MRVEFQHTFALSDGMTDYDITAEVDLDERVVTSLEAHVTATRQPGRLTRERRAKAEDLALTYAEELVFS